MAIKVMTRVWDTSKSKGNDRLLLLAIADHTDDDGICWPSIPRLAEKTNVLERQVMRNIAHLEKIGELYVEHNRGRHRNNRYLVTVGLTKEIIKIILEKRFEFDKLEAKSEADRIISLQEKGVTGDTFNDNGKGVIEDQKGVIEDIEKVSPVTGEPSYNHQLTNTITTAPQILSKYFSEKTGKQPRGIIDSQTWDDDCQDILDKANGDVTRAKGLIDESIAILTELGYPRNKPAGLLVTIDNLLKPKPQRNGANHNGHKPNPQPTAESAELGKQLAAAIKRKQRG